MSNRLSSAILRTVTGAFILNSGLGKTKLDPETAAGLQQVAATGVPAVKQLEPATFGKLLAGTEIALGAGLLTPFVNRRLIGLGLAGFASGMLTLYFRNPDNTQADGIRPTQQGIPLAKDAWLAAIGLALLFSSRSTKKQQPQH